MPTRGFNRGKNELKMHSPWIIILLLCICLLFLFSNNSILSVDGRPTSASIPATTSTQDAVITTDILAESFHLNIDQYEITKNALSKVELVGHNLWIDAGNGPSDPKGLGVNQLKTWDIPLLYSTFRTYPMYTIEVRFFAVAQSHNYFYIINDGRVAVFLENNIELWFRDDDTNYKLCNLPPSEYINIYFEVYTDTYDLYCDVNDDLEWDSNLNNRHWSDAEDTDYFIFGDTTDASYGNAQWAKFLLKGHYSNDVRFYETFNDGNAENWHFNSLDDEDRYENSQINIGSQINNNDFTDYYMQFEMTLEDAQAIISSPPIDLVKESSHTYTISMDFYARHSREYRHFTLLSDSDLMILTLETFGINEPLKIYQYVNEVYVYVCSIEQMKWYHLTVHVLDDEYTIEVNNNEYGPYNVNGVRTDVSQIFIGGSSLEYLEFDLVRVDNIYVIQDISGLGQDNDNDDISNDFEMGPFCPIYFDDFNYNINFKEYGWKEVDRAYGHGSLWGVGSPNPSTNDPDYGLENGLSVSATSKILGTNIGGYYSHGLHMLLKSPILHIPSVPTGAEGSEYEILISFWHWYNFEWEKDGGAVHLEWWASDTTPHTVNTDEGTSQIIPVGSYPCDDIDGLYSQSWGEEAGFSGSSNGWIYTEYWINYLGQNEFSGISNVYFRVVFEVGTNYQNSDYWGWYIDDIKIYISMVTDRVTIIYQSDSDNDELSDGVEFFSYGTSAMCRDTDNDGIFDGDEVDSVCRYSYEFAGDPQIRNIFLEVDSMYGTYEGDPYNWNPACVESQFLDIRSEFLNHDILFYYDFDDSISEDISDDDIAWKPDEDPNFNFYEDHAPPEILGGTFTTSRLKTWHYCFFANNDWEGDEWTWKGTSARSQYFFILYRHNIATAHVGSVVMHELGHNLGLYDYDSSDSYDNPPGDPPESSMDYNRDTGEISYLTSSSSKWFDCNVKHGLGESEDPDNYNWGNNGYFWCYGGWRYSYGKLFASDKYSDDTAGDDSGEWLGGLNYDSVRHYSFDPPNGY